MWSATDETRGVTAARDWFLHKFLSCGQVGGHRVDYLKVFGVADKVKKSGGRNKIVFHRRWKKIMKLRLKKGRTGRQANGHQS